jgi:hypothetical protein
MSTYGIIRYAPGSGLSPEDDAACFDGWYACKGDAMTIFNDWVERHPGWIVAVVEQVTASWGEGDFSSVAQRALTVRELNFSSVASRPLTAAEARRGQYEPE